MDDGVGLVADAEGAPEAPPVLLLHGGGQSRASWHNARSRLARQGFRAVALDQRGHGDSDWSPAGDYRLERFAADARAVCARLGQSVAMVGASLGGLAAAMALGEAPGAPGCTLVLVDVAHRPEMTGARRILAFMTDRPDGFASLEEAADAVAAYRPGRPRPSPESVARSLRRRPDGRWRWHWDPAFARNDGPRSLRFDTSRIVLALRSLSVPSLLIRGATSEIVSDQVMDEFRGFMPDAAFVEIAGAGHMVAGDDNDAFTGALLDFLSREKPTEKTTRDSDPLRARPGSHAPATHTG